MGIPSIRYNILGRGYPVLCDGNRVQYPILMCEGMSKVTDAPPSSRKYLNFDEKMTHGYIQCEIGSLCK